MFLIKKIERRNIELTGAKIRFLIAKGGTKLRLRSHIETN